MAIRLEKLYFAWAQRKDFALNVPELHLLPKSKCLLKGPSGSGKSTLLNLLGGVLEPQQGQIYLLGANFTAMRAAEKDAFRAEHMGYIFQMFNLIPYLSVEENCLLPLQFSRKKREKILAHSSLQGELTRLLEALGLPCGKEFLRQKTQSLSVGQQQRVAAVRAFLGSPEIIIADEPTSALDPDARQGFLTCLFQECERSAATLLYVSHDSQLEPYFDRCLSMMDFR